MKQGGGGGGEHDAKHRMGIDRANIIDSVISRNMLLSAFSSAVCRGRENVFGEIPAMALKRRKLVGHEPLKNSMHPRYTCLPRKLLRRISHESLAKVRRPCTSSFLLCSRPRAPVVIRDKLWSSAHFVTTFFGIERCLRCSRARPEAVANIIQLSRHGINVTRSRAGYKSRACDDRD